MIEELKLVWGKWVEWENNLEVGDLSSLSFEHGVRLRGNYSIQDHNIPQRRMERDQSMRMILDWQRDVLNKIMALSENFLERV